MAMTLQTIRNKMERSRKDTLKNATYYHSQKLIKFCNDSDAFNWACRYYRYNYEAFHGNMPSISLDYYADMFGIVTDKENYRYALESLKEDSDSGWNTKENTYLIKMLMALRKRYVR